MFQVGDSYSRRIFDYFYFVDELVNCYDKSRSRAGSTGMDFRHWTDLFYDWDDCRVYSLVQIEVVALFETCV